VVVFTDFSFHELPKREEPRSFHEEATLWELEFLRAGICAVLGASGGSSFFLLTTR
jgi:hypothetical protein